MDALGDLAERDVPLGPMTTYRVGGAADGMNGVEPRGQQIVGAVGELHLSPRGVEAAYEGRTPQRHAEPLWMNGDPAALGQAVVSNKKVPVRIRQALNVESGLNDGVALPAVGIAALAEIGRLVGADRCYHYHASNDGKNLLSLRQYSWQLLCQVIAKNMFQSQQHGTGRNPTSNITVIQSGKILEHRREGLAGMARAGGVSESAESAVGTIVVGQ